MDARPVGLHKALEGFIAATQLHVEVCSISVFCEEVMGDFLPGVVMYEHLCPVLNQQVWPCDVKPKPRRHATPVLPSQRMAMAAARNADAVRPRSGRQRRPRRGHEAEEVERGDDGNSEASSEGPEAPELEDSSTDVELHLELEALRDDWSLRAADADELDEGAPEHVAAPAVPAPVVAPALRPPRSFAPRPGRVLGPQAPGRRPRTMWPKLHHSFAADGTESYLRLSQTAGCEWMDIRAVCGKHHNCTRTRSCKAARPLGELWAFLDFSQHGGADCATKAQHAAFQPDFATRLAARRRLASLADSAQWLDAEAIVPGCAEEPEY